jgi:ribosomal protein L22
MDLGIFRSLVGEDWGWWRTVTLNLERIEALLDSGERDAIAGGKLDPRAQLAVLAAAAEDAPKSRRWKMRARIGERKRWYELPEETAHD